MWKLVTKVVFIVILMLSLSLALCILVPRWEHQDTERALKRKILHYQTQIEDQLKHISELNGLQQLTLISSQLKGIELLEHLFSPELVRKTLKPEFKEAIAHQQEERQQLLYSSLKSLAPSLSLPSLE